MMTHPQKLWKSMTFMRGEKSSPWLEIRWRAVVWSEAEEVGWDPFVKGPNISCMALGKNNLSVCLCMEMGLICVLSVPPCCWYQMSWYMWNPLEKPRVVERMMVPRRCLCPNPGNLWLFTWQRGLSDVIKNLEMGRLSRWTQSNHSP